MPSFSKVGLSAIRFTRRAWPFPFGRDFPVRVGAFATRIGLLRSDWFEFQPGLWMKLNARDLIQQTILLEGRWDPSLTNFIEKTVSSGDVVVDVGAHVGYFTLLAAGRVGPTGTVLSIEPNSFAVKELRQNVERSHLHNVLVEHTACGNSHTNVQLFLHTESNSSMASLSSANASSAVAVEVPCTTLDELCRQRGLSRIALVKIDVEGAELLVLHGMTRIMRKMRPAIVLELEPHLLAGFATSVTAIVRLLEDFDYSIWPLGGHANYVCWPRFAGPAGPP